MAEKQIPKTPFHFMWHVTKPHKWWGIVAMLFVTLAASTSNASPYLFKLMIDGVAGGATHADQVEALMKWGTLYIGLIILMWVLWRASGFIGMVWIVRARTEGYQRLYTYMTRHSHSYFSDRFAGSVSAKVTHAAEGTSKFIEHIMWGYYERIIGLIISAVLMSLTNVWIGAIFVGLIILLVLINIPWVKHRRPYVVSYTETLSAFKGFGVDMVTNIAAVRQYARTNRELENLAGRLETLEEKDFKQWRLSEWSLVFNNILIVGALGAIMGMMIMLFSNGSISSGDVVLVLTLIFASSGSLTFIGNAMAGATRQYGEIEEGLDAILIPHEVADGAKAKTLTVTEGAIEWKDVDFSFESNKVFDHFSLTIKPGERIGLVGPSGAGKTTFVSLLLRQHDVHAGEIRIDGQNIGAVTQDSLRENIAVVPQEPLLFHRSIRENIAYGNPHATEEEIVAVAKKAQAHDFITALSDGYDTLVGERGIKLSGGQKQRVAIARAMLKDAPILILDEATSALDSESEVAIQKALHELMEGKTVIAVAHRLSTLREMDRILVLEGGKIVEDGNHMELTQSSGTYARLWEHQAGGFLQE
ncbi:ABC transporter ATP-binding protein/permease [Candidatus Kaiserbacteria bacterium]|nr:ABC transporter ATP-binding protein/permease [Candidatus Kaiserbacteria bacterium]